MPESIVNRPKHPFRAPITQGLLHEKTEEIFSDRNFNNEGLFDIQEVKLLLNKLKTARYPSEVDNMALVGILSSHFVYDQFILNFSTNIKHTVFPDIMIDQRTINTG